MKTLPEIQEEVARLASRISAGRDVLPTYGESEDGAWPHIEVDEEFYHYVIVERGREESRFSTGILDELLFQIFQDATFQMAAAFELRHREEGRDFRRILFAKQEELLRKLSPQWAEREALNHQEILKEHPWMDS